MANKTVPGTLKVEDYLAQIDDPQRREDVQWLQDTLAELSGEPPVLWGGTLKSAIVGYGQYHYKYESGREGDFMRIGFASRARNLSIHIMPGYQDFDDELSRLGKHKMGKSCLYINRLSDIERNVLVEMMEKGLQIMDEKYPRS